MKYTNDHCQTKLNNYTLSYAIKSILDAIYTLSYAIMDSPALTQTWYLCTNEKRSNRHNNCAKKKKKQSNKRVHMLHTTVKKCTE